MRKIIFDEEELFALAVLKTENRRDAIGKLEEILPEVKEDPDMEGIVISAAEKLKRITDQEFSGLDLTSYEEDLQEEDEAV